VANVAAAIPATAAAVPDTAGMTSAFAAAIPKASEHDTAVFHGLFQDPGTSLPVASVVSQLWGVPNLTSGTQRTPGQPASSGGLANLFTDPT
jgi:hypothetical protein